MTWQQKVADTLQKANPKMVVFEDNQKTIQYSDSIKTQGINAVRGDEEVVRALLVHRLINELGYAPAAIELEKTYQAGRKNSAPKRIDTILYDAKGQPFFFIEVKAPDKFDNDKEEIETQLFALARQEPENVKYLVYYTLNTENDTLQDKAIIIDFVRYNTYDKWEDASFPSCGSMLTPHYEKPKNQPYIKGEYDLNKDFTKQFVSKLTTRLHNLLWRGTSSNEIFNALVNLILAKIQDEQNRNDGEEYKFQILQYDGEDESDEVVFHKINALYHTALDEQLALGGKPDEAKKSDVVNLDKFTMPKMMLTIRELQGLSLTEGRDKLDGKDLLGDFFEEITRTGFFQDKGQFFTPVPIVKFMLYAMETDKLAINLFNTEKRLPYIIDPSCGSGTFMIEAMKMITKELTEKQTTALTLSNQKGHVLYHSFFPKEKINTWAKDFLYASDLDFELGTSAKVNMILHGDGSAHFHIKDGLSPFSEYEGVLKKDKDDNLYNYKATNEQFDIIISNPPFSVKIDHKTQKGLSKRFLFADKKNSENLFIERYYQLLKPRGRMAIVLPESIFDTTENKYIRLFLFKYFDIKAVVSVPQVTFEPYTSTKTSLLFAQKKTADEVREWNKIWNEYGNEWARLKTRVTRYVDFFVHEKPLNKKWAWVKELGSTDFDALVTAEDAAAISLIGEADETQIKSNILRFLKRFAMPSDAALDIKTLLEKYADEITANKYDNETKEIFGYYNTAWVFAETAKHFAYPIFMAEVENVGYKRTKRGIRDTPNELYDTEIAPQHLPATKILQTYAENIAQNKALLQKDEAAKTELQTKNEQTKSKANEKSLELLEKQIEKTQNTIDSLTQDLTTLTNFITKYYHVEKNAVKHTIRAVYQDRTDSELLAFFQKGGLLADYNGEDVLLRKTETFNVLDKFRKEVIWK